ncbi:hypothetical protein [Flavitalea sp.]|nr:hypothetical protein [Flavitalea sp.]
MLNQSSPQLNLEINSQTRKTVEDSFERIAGALLSDYQLLVNDSVYRLIDIEFYYFAQDQFNDSYAHKHEAQLRSGKWYFHGSGIDLTIGNGINYGGILIRAMAEVSPHAPAAKYFILKEIHGPLKVKTEISSKLHGAFEAFPNHFHFNNISDDKIKAGMKDAEFIIKTKRIGLNAENDSQPESFYNSKYRFVIFPSLKLKDKTTIARDMQEQFPGMSIFEINKALGSKFLK